MRNLTTNKGGASLGPRAGWGKWRELRTQRILKPLRNKHALKLAAPKKAAEERTE